MIREIVAGRNMPELNSKKIEKYCQKIVDALSKHGTTAVTAFQKATSAIQSLGDISDDRLKRQTVLDDMLKKIR